MKKLTLLLSIMLFTSLSSQVIYNTTQTVTSRNYTQDVHIKNGATVKFIGTFGFASNVRVFVDNKSNIILDNATFQRLNANSEWLGIRMQGYPNNLCGQMMATTSAIFLNSTVKGAQTGIINADYSGGNEIGAAVHIENCTFDNCRNVYLFNEERYCGLDDRIINSTFFTNCQEQNPWNTSIILANDYKIVKDNTFISNVVDVFGFNSFIDCGSCTGIIEGNVFNLLKSGSRLGITASDAPLAFKFPKLWTTNELYIRDNLFGNCSVQLNLGEFEENKFVYIKNNTLLPSTTTPSSINNFGTYFNGKYTNGYYTYNKHYVSPNVMENTGMDGFSFYGNEFFNSNLRVKGTVSASSSQGQQLICNKFSKQGDEVIIESGSTGLPTQGYGIASMRYSNKNTFSTQPSINIRNSHSRNLLWYHYGLANCSNTEYPCKGVVNVNRSRLFNTDDQGCISYTRSHLGLAPPLDIDISAETRNDLSARIARIRTKISNLASTFISPCYYENIKDNYGPILLKDVDFIDISVVKNYVDDKISLYDGLLPTSELYADKGVFKSTYLEMKRELNEALERDMYMRVDVDSTISKDSIKKVFRTIPLPSADYKIAGVFIKRGWYDDAIAIYNNMKNIYSLDTIDSLNTIKMAELTAIAKAVHQSNRAYIDMTQSEINAMRSIASFQNTAAGKQACFILGRAFGECSPKDAIYNEMNVTVSPTITITPNPSSGFTQIAIENALNEENTYMLRVFNNSGVLMQEQALLGIELEHVLLDISGWQNGNYHVSLFVNETLFTSKILQKN